MMSGFQKRTLHGFSVLCLLAGFGGGSAHAGIFHHKNKPLSQKDDALASVASNQPDKELFDRAMKALKKGKFDIARLDLQTLLNTYPDSEYAMRAKLAIGDTWYKEGGTAAMQQAEEEYKDFITFFPDKPEAAEAQMKVADIYFKQMQKPDRDPTNAIRAQEEYRAMILQYPDSSLVPQAKQRLREVQEVLGDHEFTIGAYYQAQMNYAAAGARLQSIVDTYPLYGRIDEALIDIGDGYAAQARNIQHMNLDPAAKARLTKLYLARAQHAYDRVILEYPMAPHVDDARDHLEAMNLPVPRPTRQEVADSAAIEQSRAPINLKYKATILITARPSTVQAAHVGEPSLVDPKQIIAPSLVKEGMADVQWAIKPDGKPAPGLPGTSNNVNEAVLAASSGPASALEPAATNGNEPSATPSSAMQMHDLSNGDTNVNGAVVNQNNNSTNNNQGEPMNAVQAPVGTGSGTPTVPKPNVPRGPNGQPTVWPSAVKDNGGLPTVAGTNSTPLPAATRASEAPVQKNDVKSSGQAENSVDQGATANGKKKKKNPKPKFTSGEESSSTHKKKKGLRKLNPF